MRRLVTGVCLLVLWSGVRIAAQDQCFGSLSVPLNIPMGPGGFHVQMKAGGAKPHSMQVDTGSTGIVVGYPHIGGSPVPLTPQEMAQYGLTGNYLLYNSTGDVVVGHWVFTSLAFGDGTTWVTVDRIPVLSVDHTCKIAAGTTVPPPSCLNARAWKVDCAAPLPRNCQTLPIRRRPQCSRTKQLCGMGMMGVGFDRGASMGNAGVNPFLHAQQMETGAMHPGYVITTSGITVGIKQQDLQGFGFVPLQPVKGGNELEWRQTRGCVSVAGTGITNPRQTVCGEILMDTGVDRMFLSYASGSAPELKPPNTLPLKLWDCPPLKNGARNCRITIPNATVTVTSPHANPVLRYEVSAPATFVWTGVAPAFVSLRATTLQDPGENVFVNTSRQLLNMVDYLYDAGCGRVGFRRR